MTSPDPPRAADRSSRLYRLLVRLMPFEFRSDFGEEMTDVFRQERRDAALEGRGGLASLWLRTVAGMVRTAGRQHLDALWQDVRYAARGLRRTPALTLVAVVSLALGIGANTAIFSFLNVLSLRPLPAAADPSELVGVYARSDGRVLPGRLTHAEFEALRATTRTLSDVAAHTETWVWLTGEGREPAELYAGAVSPNYFSVLGLRPAIGRLLFASDGVESPVAVLAYHVWQSRFAGDPAVLGHSVTLNQRRFTVVGVTPKGFTGVYAGGSRDLWIATGVYDGWSAGDGYDLVGRLVAGRTVAEVQAELNVLANVARSPASARVESAPASREASIAAAPVRGVHPFDRAQVTRTPLLLFGAVAFLLLIACANLAGLLLARSAARRHEMAVRVSLGATRGRLLRQLLTESLLLSAIGAAASLLVAVWAGWLIETHFSYLFARLEVGFDWRVLVFTLGIALASGIAFGIAPALDSSRVEPFGSLQAEGARRTTGRSSLRTAFLIGQVALSVALLVGALVMVQSLGNLVDRPGYAQDEIAHYRLRPSRVNYEANRAAVYYGELTRRLAQVPGVRAVVYASFPPVRAWGATSSVGVLDTGGSVPLVQSVRNEVSPGFFRELGIAIARGREFDAQDLPGAPPVAVVNESLGRRLWGESDPLGSRVVVDEQTFTVVGIARDIYAARDGELPLSCVYLSHAQRRVVDARLFVRVEGDAEAMVPVLRRHLVEVDPNVHIGQEMTLRQRTTLSFEFERLTTRVLAASGGVALILTAIGLYGILSFWVSQRTREIGVRMSLGADARAILRLVIRQGMAPVSLGLILGVILTLLSMSLLASLLYGVSGHDPLALAGAAFLVIGVALAACCLPARRAARVDPATALRAE